jgi:uncharacterized membrane protein YfcA
MQIIGFFLGVAIGISLGLIGSGGSILTIPILVYLMKIPPSKAITYSLFIVGISALVGTIKAAKDKLLDYKTAFYFGLPSIISIVIMRRYIMPIIPNTLLRIETYTFTKDYLIMLVFSVLMIVSSVSMIRSSKTIQRNSLELNYNIIVLNGIIIGILAGFVGVGGGFLIIPTLLFSAKLTMKKAVATSLIIISFNALFGFLGSIGTTVINWIFLLEFTAFAVVGILLGIMMSKYVSNERLKPTFGWFVLATGIYILIKESF